LTFSTTTQFHTANLKHKDFCISFNGKFWTIQTIVLILPHPAEAMVRGGRSHKNEEVEMSVRGWLQN
jgi:hypothetical protein